MLSLRQKDVFAIADAFIRRVSVKLLRDDCEKLLAESVLKSSERHENDLISRKGPRRGRR